jgi:endoglucanase
MINRSVSKKISAFILISLLLLPVVFEKYYASSSVNAQESTDSPSADVYSDKIHEGWGNWSWKSNINFSNPNPTQSGERSIYFSPQPWGGLYLNSRSPIEITSGSLLSFHVYPTLDNQKFKIIFFDTNSKELKTSYSLSEVVSSLPAKKWTRVEVPLEKIRTESSAIKGFALMESGGIDSSTVFVDSISVRSGAVLSTGNAQNIFTDKLSPGWSDWSWGGMSKFDSVITYTQSSPWGGFYLRSNTSYKVSDQSYLNFELRTAASGQSYKVAVYGENGSVINSFIMLDTFGGQPGNSDWKSYNIPVSKLNPANANIRGFAVHDSIGKVQPSLMIRNVQLLGVQAASQSDTDVSQPEPSQPAPSQPAPSEPVNTAPVSSKGSYTAANNKIYRNGSAVQLKGISWFGFETSTNVVHGLWARNWKDQIVQMKSLGFNSVRVPFCPATLKGVTPTSIDYSKNDDLRGLNSLQILDKVMKELNDQGLYILLDHHTPDCKTITNLWYTSSYSEEQWLKDLTFVASRYKDLPFYMGLDIKNEPQGTATWGTGDVKTDWKIAAEKAGKQVLAANPNLLIFVQGVQTNPKCSSNTGHWWGGNLEPVECYPINNSAIPADKLVFSPHVYGPDVHWQSYFSASNFPSNMTAIWEKHFGYLVDKGYTIVPGEWGGKYGNGGHSADKTWQDAFVNYMKTKKICNSYYWDWNPNSTDTGGVLQNDWKTPWQNKVTMLNNYFNTCR